MLRALVSEWLCDLVGLCFKTFLIDIFFQTTFVLEEVEGDPVAIAVHPSGDEIVCSLSKGSCK